MTLNILDGGDQPQIDETKNYLEDLVGDGKKFKTPEDLAKGKWHSDQTIEIQNKRLDAMAEENRKLREENIAKAKLEDLINQAIIKQSSSSEKPPVNEQTPPPAIKPEDIESIVANKIAASKANDKATENFNTFKAKLTERFGNNEAALNQQIANLGLDKEDLIQLARKSPNAAIRTLGLDRQEQNFQSPPSSSQRNDNFAPTSGKKLTWSYWQDYKKKNPDWLYDRKIANQMAEAAAELGDAFFDGDFYVKGLHDK